MDVSLNYEVPGDSGRGSCEKVDEKIYRELGGFGLLDGRGRRKQYRSQDRYVQKLKRENELLKKCLVAWKEEVNKRDIRSWKR
ncbi:hypothetical protein D6D84_05300 [Moraxella catarrhalis]|nr:hypothetical protein D6D84_05300 [Moraxella catarrhalis]